MRKVWMSPSPDMRVNAERAHAKGKLLMDHGVPDQNEGRGRQSVE
jgi:hypothetical protein